MAIFTKYGHKMVIGNGISVVCVAYYHQLLTMLRGMPDELLYQWAKVDPCGGGGGGTQSAFLLK